MRREDLIGRKFGMLTVIADAPNKGICRYLVCRCDCGETLTRKIDTLKRSWVSKCMECKKKTAYKVHGMKNTKEYSIWKAMKKRCANKNDTRFHQYGGRGITVSATWVDSFETFYKDMGPIPSEKHSIDRIDTNGNYEPSNCRWATSQQQARTRRTTNDSGVAGVLFDKKAKKWKARIFEEKNIVLGTFDNLFDAICARKSAENKYWNGCNL